MDERTFLRFVTIETNPRLNSFSLQRYAPEPFELASPSYSAENYASADIKQGKVSLAYRTGEADPKSIRGPVTIASVSGRKPGDFGRAIDFWTNPSEHHIVSDAARTFIETHDPDIHKFYPVDLAHKENGERFGDKQYFYWIIGRAVLLEPASAALEPEGYENPEQHVAAGPVMGRLYATLAQHGEILARLDTSPFWCFAPIGSIHMSAATHAAALFAGLSGIELGDPKTHAVRHASITALRQMPEVRVGLGWRDWFKR